jgi:hypothetical protein
LNIIFLWISALNFQFSAIRLVPFPKKDWPQRKQCGNCDPIAFIVLFMKAKNTVTGRDLRRGNSEDRLASNEKLLVATMVATKGGQVFEMRRVEQGKRNILTELNQIIKEIPIARPAPPGD